MNLFIGRLCRKDLPQEALEIHPFLGFRDLLHNVAGGHVQGGEEIDRAVTFVMCSVAHGHLRGEPDG